VDAHGGGWLFKVDRAGAPNGHLWVGHRTGLMVARLLSFFFFLKEQLARFTANQIWHASM
jgi:hypothetical protein